MTTFRDARADEAPALEALQRRSSDVWEEYRADLAAHPDAIEVPADAIEDGRVRVAQDADGTVVGFSVVVAGADGALELDGLFVEPSAMRGGIGRALVDDAAARARRDGVQRLEVVANPRAVAFYERVGFRRGADVPTRFGPAVAMRLDL